MSNCAARAARRAFVTVAAAALVGLLFAACGENHVEPLPPDTTPPIVEVLFPTSPDTYDEDGDGLADFRIAYRDSAGVIDVAQLTVHSLRPVDGPVAGGDLLTAWTVDQRDDTLLVFHETIENLLPSQTNQLVVAVVDTAGNVTEDTIRIELPFGALHTTILTGISGDDVAAAGMVYCADDHRLYVNTSHPSELVAIDPDTLTVVAHDGISTGVGFGAMLCLPGDPMLYIAGDRVLRYDRLAGQWATDVAGTNESRGMAVSRRDSNRLYVGQARSGTIAIVDRAQAERVGTLLPIVSDKWVDALAVLPNDATLYATVWPDVGLLVVDPWANVVLDTIDLAEGHPSNGYAMHMRLSRNATKLWVGVTDGPPAGVWEIDTRINEVVRIFDLSEYRVINLALSPDERRMFVTTQDRFVSTPSENVLLDVATWTELARFPRPRPPGTIRWDQQVTFHPSGKVVFVSHNQDVEVYLNRK